MVNDKIFPIGSRVIVKHEYKDGKSIRYSTGTVLNHVVKDDFMGRGQYIDNLVCFDDDYTVEPFGNWELDLAPKPVIKQLNSFDVLLFALWSGAGLTQLHSFANHGNILNAIGAALWLACIVAHIRRVLQ